MLEVNVKTTKPQTVAYIAMCGPYDLIPQAMGTLYGWVQAHGYEPVGMPSGVYLSDPTVEQSQARWMLRAPISDDVADTAPDEAGCGTEHVAAHLVASALHRGPYDTVEATYRELGEWVGANGYRMAGPPEEFYLSDPDDTAPEDYLTEIHFSIEKA